MGELISLAEYARRNGKAAKSVRDMAERGRFLTAQKIGRNWVIDSDESYPERPGLLDKYLDDIGWRGK